MSKHTKSRIVICLICLLIPVLLVFNAIFVPPVEQIDDDMGTLASPSDISIELIQRSIEVSEFGLVTVHENLTVHNIGSYPLNGCELSHPQTYTKKVTHLLAYDSDNNTQLRISKPYTRGGIELRSVIFDRIIQPEERYHFKLTTVYTDCISLNEEISGYYYVHMLDLEMPLYPMSPYSIEKITARVDFFEYLDVPQAFNDYSPHADFIKDEVLYYERSELKPNHIEMLKVNYYSDLPPARFTSARRTIEFDPWGYIHVTEVQTLKNTGMDFSYIDQLPFFVPTDATNVRAHDDLGNLTLAVSRPGDDYEGPPQEQLNGTIFTRVQVIGNHSYTFTLRYTLNLENHTIIENGKYLLSTNLYTLMNIQIDSLDIELVVPEGCTLNENHVCNTTNSYQDFTRRVYRLMTDEQSAAIDSEIVLSINIAIVSLNMRPMFISFIIGIIAITATLLRLAQKVILPTKPQIPKYIRQTIEQFCNAYELRIAYRIDMGQLSHRKRRGDVDKEQYIRERGGLLSKLEKSESRLATVKKELLNRVPVLQEIITKIEQLEEQRTSARSMTATALANLKKREIQKSTFDRIFKEQRSKLRSADNEIDRILLELREEYL